MLRDGAKGKIGSKSGKHLSVDSKSEGGGISVSSTET